MSERRSMEQVMEAYRQQAGGNDASAQAQCGPNWAASAQGQIGALQHEMYASTQQNAFMQHAAIELQPPQPFAVGPGDTRIVTEQGLARLLFDSSPGLLGIAMRHESSVERIRDKAWEMADADPDRYAAEAAIKRQCVALARGCFEVKR